MTIKNVLQIVVLCMIIESQCMSSYSRYLKPAATALLFGSSAGMAYLTWLFHKKMERMQAGESYRQQWSGLHSLVENPGDPLPARLEGLPEYESLAQKAKSSRNWSIAVSLGLFAAGVYAVKKMNVK